MPSATIAITPYFNDHRATRTVSRSSTAESISPTVNTVSATAIVVAQMRVRRLLKTGKTLRHRSKPPRPRSRSRASRRRMAARASAGSGQGVVHSAGPLLPEAGQPVPGVGGARLPRTAAGRLLRVGPLETRSRPIGRDRRRGARSRRCERAGCGLALVDGEGARQPLGGRQMLVKPGAHSSSILKTLRSAACGTEALKRPTERAGSPLRAGQDCSSSVAQARRH